MTLAAAALAVSVAAPAAAGSTTAHREVSYKTPLQKGIAFYKGKTITFVSPDSPGGGFNQWAVDVQPFLAQYLHATVNVESIPAGNTIAGQDFVAHAAGNGLTVGWMNAGPDIEDEVLNLPALNFNPEREAFLGATNPGYTAFSVLNTGACQQWTTFSKILTNGSTSNTVKEVLQTTGTGTFLILMVNAAFGIHFTPLIGYASTALQTAGFERGDGCLTETPDSTIASFDAPGKAVPVAVSEALPPADGIASTFANAPTLQELYTKYKSQIDSSKSRLSAWKTVQDIDDSTRIFFAPEATPTPQRLALEWAFKQAIKNPTLKSELIAQGNPTGMETGPYALNEFKQFTAAAKREAPVLRATIG